MNTVRYDAMLPHAICTRRAACPAAFVPLGGLEWHGEHLAVGNDALKAERLCELAAEASGGFAFPPLWYGEPRVLGLMEVNFDDDSGIKRSMGFDPAKFDPAYFGNSGEEQLAFYRQLLRHLLIQLHTLEMRAVCLLCGHYPIMTWAAPVVEQFNQDFPTTQVFAGTEFAYVPDCPEVGGDHAAVWETSYLWHLRPDCVDMSVYNDHDPAVPLIGLMGEDPRGHASVERGRIACELIVAGMTGKMRELLARAYEKSS